MIDNKPESVTNKFHFEPNKSSPDARRIVVVKLNVTFELWFDNHYHKTYEFGDERGERVGIGPEMVESLVTRSIEHLLSYSLVSKGLKLGNHEKAHEFPNRIVLKEEVNESILNVVIEVHHNQ